MRRIFTTYEIVTPESAEEGDVAERGYVEGNLDSELPAGLIGEAFTKWCEENVKPAWTESVHYDEHDGLTLPEQVAEWLDHEGYTDPSSSDYRPGSWYSWPDAQPDMYTGADRMQSAHLGGFTREEEIAVGKAMCLLARRFTLDGEGVHPLGFLCENNEDFTEEDRERVYSLKVGEEIVYGGGAFATFTLKRVK